MTVLLLQQTEALLYSTPGHWLSQPSLPSPVNRKDFLFTEDSLILKHAFAGMLVDPGLTHPERSVIWPRTSLRV